MSERAVFVLDGDRFSPGPDAIGPWRADNLHGGPVLGLVARAVVEAEPDPELVLARLTIDMFRPVGTDPLGVRVERLRKGSRLALLRVLVIGAGESALAQGTALLLRASEGVEANHERARMPTGPEGLLTEGLMRGGTPRGVPPGFHTCVETRWVVREGQPLAIWFRLPIPLVAGEPTRPLVAACALCDFANAVASIAAGMRNPHAQPYINADASIFLTRAPEGEWFCLQDLAVESERGVSTSESRLYDARGPLGRVVQSRLVVR